MYDNKNNKNLNNIASSAGTANFQNTFFGRGHLKHKKNLQNHKYQSLIRYKFVSIFSVFNNKIPVQHARVAT